MATDSSSTSPSKGQAWFCTTDLPSDVVVEVEAMTFHLHKSPLMSKSKTLHDLITEQEANGQKREDKDTYMDNCQDNDDKPGEDEEEDGQYCHVSLPHFPGGSETFETVVKFCYGAKIELTAGNAASLWCAGEVLRMTEDVAQDNLISKTEKFFNNSVFNNIKDSIKALKSCEKLCPFAEKLGIVQRCIDAILAKAGHYDPTLFGWPVNESAGDPRNSPSKLRDPWVEDLAKLSSDFFNRVISAMTEKEIDQEIVDACLMHYAKRRFPGIYRSSRRTTPTGSPLSIASEAEQRKLLETIVSNLSPENSSRSSAETRFLFGLLRTANILNASDVCKFALERKISAQLENATLDDLLIPSYSYLSETLYDVDCVQRMLRHFLESYEEREIEDDDEQSLGNLKSPAILLVGKLIDGYLSEIASDANLKPERFYELAISLPEQARSYDDGIYRAIDVYLKAHPWITEGEREKISSVMNCQKLTLEACTHAAQNDRLPVRTVVQVIFFEQLQLRHAIAGTLIGSHCEERETAHIAATRKVVESISSSSSSSSKWREAMRENQVLRLDMDSMRNRVKELERECSTMKKVIEKIDKVGNDNASNGNGKGWRSKFGCKFTTKVCSSHGSTVVDDRKAGHRRSRC